MREIGESSYRRFLQGDSQALEALICTYSDALVRFAYSYVKNSAVAEDLVADTFALLYKVAYSRCVDHLRKHKKEIPLEDVEDIPAFQDVQADYLRRDRNEKLYLCMQRLPEQYRELLQLTYFSGFSLEECGNILGKSRKQIYNLHNRAKITLKLLLEKEGITDEDVF